MTDVDGDGEADVVVAAKSTGDTPAPIDLFVYQYRDDTWTKTKQISLGEACFGKQTADCGLWMRMA